MAWTKMEKISRLRNSKILIFIFLLGFFLRFYRLSELPQGFNGDEAAVGYYAYSLINNISDEYGNKLPLYFPSIGDYKYPGYSYLSTIPVLIFGLNIFSARFLSAFLGSLLVLLVYFLAEELFQKRRISLIASGLAAISPYGILFSRGAYESNVAMFFLTVGIFTFLYFYNRERYKRIFLAIIPFIISIYTYPSPRLFLIFFIPAIILIIIYKTNISVKSRKILLFFGGLILFFVALSLIDPRGRIRADDIGFLRDPWPKKYLVDSIHEDGLAYQGKYLFITRAFHNKPVAYGLSIAERYLEHFDPVYLFMTSNPDMPRYFIPNVGLLYYFEILTVFVGLYALSKLSDRSTLFLASWILIAAFPSALSIESPSPVRALIGLPAWILLSAIGVWMLFKWFFKNRVYLFCTLVVVVFCVHLFYFWHQFSIHDYYRQPWYSDEKVKEMVKTVSKLEDNFDKVVIPDDPYIHFLFFNKVSPKDFLSKAKIEEEQLGKWERVNEFGRIIFKMPYACPKIGRINVLYVCKGEEIPQNSRLYEVVRYQDGKPAYLFIEFVPYSEREMEELPERVHYMVETDLNFPEALLSEDSGRYW